MAKRRRILLRLVTVFVFLGAVAADPASAQQADPVDVTVTFMHYVEIENPDPLSGPGDYYGGVCWPQKDGEPDCPVSGEIGPLMAQTSGFGDNDPDVEPFATVTKTFDRVANSTAKFELTVWDFDPGIFQGADDVMDINPADNTVTLTIMLDLTTGSWMEFNSDIPDNVGFGQGDGDTGLGFMGPGGEAGKLLFDISLSDDGDGDDDGIPDGIETSGVRDIDGNLIANMSALGADPCRKTIATEIDFMESQGVGHSHRPQQAALDEAKNAFAAAPVPTRPSCPYSGFPSRNGINLLVHVDDPIPEQASLAGNQGDACKKGLADARKSFFHAARRRYFHYSLWVHDLVQNDSTSGIACSTTPDFIVSLGSWANSVGTVRNQSATFMHELGHTLGLGHGGIDSINFKPNYLSVMNYAFPTGVVAAGGALRLDYSRQTLPTLDETALNETAGIGGGTDSTRFFDPVDNVRLAAGNGPIDWNWSSQGLAPFQSSVAADINGDTTCVRFGLDGASDTTVAGDDVLVGNPSRAIRVGPNRMCESRANSNPSTPGPVDDFQVTAAGFPCVLSGADGVLQTTAAAGEGLGNSLAGPFLSYGSNLTCDSTAKAGSDDVQATPVGQSVPTLALAGFDDWSSLVYASGFGRIGTPWATGQPDITHEEAEATEAFWRDALTVPTASVIAPTTLTGSAVVSFSEDVEGVADQNLVLRLAGSSANLAAALSCRDSSGGPVECSSSAVRSAVLTPYQPLVPGEHYAVVVAPLGAPSSITDGAGNATAFASTSFRGSLIEDEASVAARYAWQEVAKPQAYGGSYSTDHLKGATASYTFRGTMVTWYTVTGPTQGLAYAYVDGTLVQTTDQYSPVTQYRVPRNLGGLPWGEHTLTIRVAGLANPASHGTFVSVDAVGVGDGEPRPTAPLRFTWQPNSAFEDVTGTNYVRAELNTQDVAFTFRGPGITWVTVRGPDQGDAELWIDGALWATVHNYAPSMQYGVPVKVTGLADAVHTLRIVVPGSSGSFVSVDGWRVH